MTILIINNEHPVNLDGFLHTGDLTLQLKHGSDVLADYEDTIEANHATSSVIRVKLLDFTSGVTTWTLSATHDYGGTQTWSTGSGHVYYDFDEEITTPLEVKVEATDGAAVKKRKIYITVKPSGTG